MAVIIMYTKLLIVLLIIFSFYSGSKILNMQDELSKTQKEFSDYKEKVDRQLKDIIELQNKRNGIKSDFIKSQKKAVNDSVREDIVTKKPKLVERQFNKSFEDLTKSVYEATK